MAVAGYAEGQIRHALSCCVVLPKSQSGGSDLHFKVAVCPLVESLTSLYLVSRFAVSSECTALCSGMCQPSRNQDFHQDGISFFVPFSFQPFQQTMLLPNCPRDEKF